MHLSRRKRRRRRNEAAHPGELVPSSGIARPRGGPGPSLLELIQEDNIGLMLATEKYKHRRKYRFSTYAIWWIRQSIERSKLEN